jgi:acyl carrier protein
MSLEDEFNVSISDDAAQNIKTVQDLVNYIEAEQAK